MPAMNDPTATFVLAVVLAVGAQVLAGHLRLPAIVLWLSGGMLLGSSGLQLLDVSAIQPAMLTLIELGLAVILFEGGLNLNLRALRKQGWVVGRLVVFGPVITMFLGGGLLHLGSGLAWDFCLLFGALVAVGGPTVIMPIVRQTRLDRKLRHILTGEAMLIDAVGAMLAIVMLQIVISGNFSVSSILPELFAKFFIGIACGWLGGRMLALVLEKNWLKDTDFRPTATLALVWALFYVSNQISEQAGLMAVLVAGAVLQSKKLPDIQRLRRFKGSLSTLLVGMLFVLLAAGLDLSIMVQYLPQGMLLFLALVLLIRPLVVASSALGSDLSRDQRKYLAMMAPRGVVAAAITALFSVILTREGIPGGEILEALVYIIIIFSVLLYGLIANPLSRYLHVEGADERSVLIVGGGQIGAELGRALSDDREVRFLDLNAEVIGHLQRSGFEAVRGNALDPMYMEIIHAEEIGIIVAMTGSSDHNLLIAQLARDDFHIPEAFVALQQGDEIKQKRMIHRLQARRLFAKSYTATYWNDQAYRKRLIYESFVITADSPLVGVRLGDARIQHGVQPMVVIHDGQTNLPHDGFVFSAGDEIKVLLRPNRVQGVKQMILPPTTHADNAGKTA
ncbi:MAG: cation:proton antiporter [Mariprofundaceae bacterium]